MKIHPLATIIMKICRPSSLLRPNKNHPRFNFWEEHKRGFSKKCRLPRWVLEVIKLKNSSSIKVDLSPNSQERFMSWEKASQVLELIYLKSQNRK
jgi:antitoxin component of MazEF toxin-antitoxin module